MTTLDEPVLAFKMLTRRVFAPQLESSSIRLSKRHSGGSYYAEAEGASLDWRISVEGSCVGRTVSRLMVRFIRLTDRRSGMIDLRATMLDAIFS